MLINITKMKILYSDIKRLVPGLKKTPREVGEALTLTGFMLDGFEEVKHRGKKDHLLGLEIRQNRPDGLSVFGIAKEVAAYYGLKAKLPTGKTPKTPKNGLGIKVEEKESVKKVRAVRIKGIKNTESPVWLKEFLSFYDINPINLSVDVSNYVMLMTGYPSHLFDADKLSGNLVWSLNKEFDRIVTLDGSEVKLNKDEMIIKDDKNILCLAGIVGGEVAKIESETKDIVLEMAVYEHSLIGKNARSLNMVTEAGNRLSKNLDPAGVDSAFDLLVSMTLEYCGGEVDSSVFEHSSRKEKPVVIKFDLSLPGVYAGVDIPEKISLKILKDLGFEVKGVGSKVSVTPPVGRKDVSVPEDLVEEVIRVFGYDKIPYEETPALKVPEKITPLNLVLIDKMSGILTSLGFDEILSKPMVRKGENARTNYLNWKEITTENAINEEYPDLRQTTAIGLINTSKKHLKKNIKYVSLFEVGKVFGKRKGVYEERELMGVFYSPHCEKPGLSEMKVVIERVLRSVGVADISYRTSKSVPGVANPHSCWEALSKGEVIGIVYKMKPGEIERRSYFAEFDIENVLKVLNKTKNISTVELDQKLVVLDANVEMEEGEYLFDCLEKMKKKIGEKNVWGMEVIDEFPVGDRVRYTVRVYYYDLSDQDAKKIHLKVFES